MATLPRLPRRGVLNAALTALGLLVMVGVLGGLLVRGQVAARDDLRARFALRAELTAGFVRSLLAQGHDLRLAPEASEVSAHLASVVPIPEQRAYLLDADRVVVAASVASTVGSRLEQVEPALGAPSPGETPTYPGSRRPGEHVAAVARVGDSPYVVLLTVPTARLYQPLVGTVWPQWLMLGLFAVVSVLTVLLLLRLMRRETQLDWALRVDPVTGVRNRRHLQERLPEVSSAAARHGRPWALLMIDIDHFKRINDEQGHAAGDEVLREVGLVIATEARREDLAGRWGGDEFLAILADTDLAGAEVVARRIAARVRERLGEQRSLSIGCAAGVEDDPDALLHRADAALYEAKRLGRNRVALAPG